MHKHPRNEKSVKPVNYSLDSQKITFEFLSAHLWSASDILRGSLDAAEYRQPVMTLLFLKRLNDTFEENVEKLIKKGIREKDAWTLVKLPEATLENYMKYGYTSQLTIYS